MEPAPPECPRLDRAEAENLTDGHSGQPGGIDVFFVQTIGDADGWSNVDGPCNKASSDGLTGAVREVSGSRRFTGVLLGHEVGHEVGHYLGLGTGTSPTNVMGVDQVPPGGDGVDELTDHSTGLTEWSIFVNRDLGSSFSARERLLERPWIAALLALWAPPAGAITTHT